MFHDDDQDEVRSEVAEAIKEALQRNRQCGVARVNRGVNLGPCQRAETWHCKYCKANRCASHAPSGRCEVCNSKCTKI